MSQDDLSKAVKALEGIGSVGVEVTTPSKPVRMHTQTLAQRDNTQAMRFKRTKPALNISNGQDKTLDRRESFKQNFVGGKGSDDSLDRASE